MTDGLDRNVHSRGATVGVSPNAQHGRGDLARATLCFVVDEETSVRQFLSLILHGAGIDTVEFADGGAMRQALDRNPHLIFLNIGAESSAAIDTLVALGKRGYRGYVQLISGRSADVLDHVKTVGDEQRLHMLPVLKKPFDMAAVKAIIAGLKLGESAPHTGRVRLSEALANDWIEFWYQPKIDLRKKQLAGVETFARCRHPQFGTLAPGAFMPDASKPDIVTLSERAVARTLKTALMLSSLGIHLRFAVNMPLYALVKLPIIEMVRPYRDRVELWSGLIIDVTEAQLLSDISLAVEAAKRLEPLNVRLAIDDFSGGLPTLVKLRDLPFTEIKIDRALVTDCGVDRTNAPQCKKIIDLAHNFCSTAVAIGIEKAADALTLTSMGCDIGQGFLLGQPMPEERLMSLLRQRAAGQSRSVSAGG